MPHQCTNCGRTFADGSKEMLSGCPDCGGNKFQFAPSTTAAAESFDEGGGSGSVAPTETESVNTAESDEDTSGARTATAESDSVTTRAAETVREFVSSRSSDQPSDDVDGTNQSQSAGTTVSRSDGSRPSSANSDTVERESPTGGEFDEWPETARRPEDRTADSSESTESDRADHDDYEDHDAGSDVERAEGAAAASTDGEHPAATLADDENSAQADARSEVVPSDDLPPRAADPERRETAHEASGYTDDRDMSATATPGDDSPPEHGRVVSEPSGDRPSIEELRAELNEQFESIKIVRPGQYELNLMELYNRDEYIISLQEDGRYVIDVPDSWRGDDGDD
ncbi:Zn-ribbon containing protein [Natrinema sp. 74]|uniref:OapC/ArvC family zinc-ribbon domain-containing protein n=1 Tax=Natrinema sp. 74 TaxID=3384159 RepID=UPI0038D4435E